MAHTQSHDQSPRLQAGSSGQTVHASTPTAAGASGARGETAGRGIETRGPQARPSAAKICHLDLVDFLVTVERKQDPSLRDKPVVVGGQPTGWGRVVAASAEAAMRGVRPGLSLAIAASRCPDAVFVDGAFDRYLDASAAIDELLRESGVPVEWASIDSVFLDLTDSVSRLGPARQVAEHVQQMLRDQLGFEASCGIASTKVAAQIASQLARPTGLLYVLPGYERRFLAALDADLLPDLPPGVPDRLKRAGVLTLGQLAALDAAAAETLLGRRAPEFVRHARGEDDRGVDGSAPPRSVARDVTLPQPTQDGAQLESATQYLTETLASRLRRMSCFAQTVTVRVRGGSPERTYARALTLREATAADADLVTASRALLHTLRRTCRTISSITIALSGLQRSGAQMPLFPLAPPTTRDRWMNVRTRSSIRAMVDGRFLEHGHTSPRRRAG
jgi:DNA polymerase-4